MSVLAAIQSFAAFSGTDIPTRVFGSDDRHEVELQYLANEMAVRITSEYDWAALARTFTITTDGLATDWPLPADFARFRLDAEIVDDAGRRLDRTASIDVALFQRAGTRPNSWLVRGNLVVFGDASARTVAGTYQSGWFAQDITGAKPRFTADDDAFVLPERLLTLAMIWQWKAGKGLPYGQDYDNYTMALAMARGAEGQRAVQVIGRRRLPPGVVEDWPFQVVPGL